MCRALSSCRSLHRFKVELELVLFLHQVWLSSARSKVRTERNTLGGLRHYRGLGFFLVRLLEQCFLRLEVSARPSGSKLHCSCCLTLLFWNLYTLQASRSLTNSRRCHKSCHKFLFLSYCACPDLCSEWPVKWTWWWQFNTLLQRWLSTSKTKAWPRFR